MWLRLHPTHFSPTILPCMFFSSANLYKFWSLLFSSIPQGHPKLRQHEVNFFLEWLPFWGGRLILVNQGQQENDQSCNHFSLFQTFYFHHIESTSQVIPPCLTLYGYDKGSTCGFIAVPKSYGQPNHIIPVFETSLRGVKKKTHIKYCEL